MGIPPILWRNGNVYYSEGLNGVKLNKEDELACQQRELHEKIVAIANVGIYA
jgi:hypothetical protein